MKAGFVSKLKGTIFNLSPQMTLAIVFFVDDLNKLRKSLLFLDCTVEFLIRNGVG